jgi:phosphatidylglycerol:prolipoprotein diacylglycerol transferase
MAFDFPNIDPVAFAVGPIEIRWYALAYMAGFILGWQYCLYLVGLGKEGRRPFKTDIDDFLP